MLFVSFELSYWYSRAMLCLALLLLSQKASLLMTLDSRTPLRMQLGERNAARSFLPVYDVGARIIPRKALFNKISGFLLVDISRAISCRKNFMISFEGVEF